MPRVRTRTRETSRALRVDISHFRKVNFRPVGICSPQEFTETHTSYSPAVNKLAPHYTPRSLPGSPPSVFGNCPPARALPVFRRLRREQSHRRGGRSRILDRGQPSPIHSREFKMRAHRAMEGFKFGLFAYLIPSPGAVT